MEGSGAKYKVKKWKDGNGTIYNTGDTAYWAGDSIDQIPNADNIFLYAVDATKVDGFTLSFNGNIYTSGSAPASAAYGSGVSVTLPANTGSLKKTGYSFVGWCADKNGSDTVYSAGSSYTITANTTLYAVWGLNLMLNFNDNGSTDASPSVPNQIITGNNTVTVPALPGTLTKTGYTFGGWNTCADGTGSTYSEGQAIVITCNTALFAKWNGNTVAGNGIAVSAVNDTTQTISSSRKFYYEITTDQYFRNSGSVVESGSIDAAGDTINVDLPVGKYYVRGYIDNDGSASLTKGDYVYAATDYLSGFAYQWYVSYYLKAFDVTETSGYQSAQISFYKGDSYTRVNCFTYQGDEAVVHVQFSYTGTKTLSANNQLFVLGSTNSDLSVAADRIAGSITPSTASAKSLTVIAHIPLNTAYYFGGCLEPVGVAFSNFTGCKYHNVGWSGEATPFIATKSIVYGIIESFGD